jgi:hypothetical protein
MVEIVRSLHPWWKLREYSQGRQEKTQRQARKDRKAGWKRLKYRLEKIAMQTRKDSKAG